MLVQRVLLFDVRQKLGPQIENPQSKSIYWHQRWARKFFC